MKHIKIYSILLIFAGLIFTGSNALAQQAGNFDAVTDSASFDTDAGSLSLTYDRNEDTNDNGQLDNGEDLDGDGELDTSPGLTLEATNPAGTDPENLDIQAAELTHNGVEIANADDIGDLETADTQLQTNINAEANARTNADTELQTNIDAEAGIRETMDTAIAGAIGLTAGEDGSYSYIANTEMNYINEATSVIEATEQLDRALYNESQERISADNELRTSIEQNQSDIETNRKGIAMVAAMTHTTLLPGNSKALDIGIGYFESESAYSINYAGRLNENVQVNFSAASTSGLKDSAVRCSLGFQW